MYCGIARHGRVAADAPAWPSASRPHGSAARTSEPKQSPYEMSAQRLAAMYSATAGEWISCGCRRRLGALIRFSTRGRREKAQVLHDKKAEPHLIGLRSHAMLSFRRWKTSASCGRRKRSRTQGLLVLFSNKGDLVKVGDA